MDSETLNSEDFLNQNLHLSKHPSKEGKKDPAEFYAEEPSKPLILDSLDTQDVSTFMAEGDSPKSKTSLRMKYEAQAQVLRRKLGGLEGVQNRLHLTQRKMAQLLLVDPSSLNRWSKNEDSVPPHIWRALEWLHLLEEKMPGIQPQYFIGWNSSAIDLEQKKRIQTEKEAREKSLEDLQLQLDRLKKEKGTLSEDMMNLEKSLKKSQRSFIALIGILFATILGLGGALLLKI